MITLEKVGPDNVSECGIGCLINKNNQGHQPKIEWLKERFEEGLRFFLFRDDIGKPLGFLEYAPGEYAWRPVDAKGWLFVHCLWVYQKGEKIGGLGGQLIEAVIEEAKKAKAIGVVAMVSDGSWMAGKEIFLKHGFEVLDSTDRFELVAHRLKKGKTPKFRDIRGHCEKYNAGLHIVYSAQCPMLPKSVNDLSVMAAEHGVTLKTTRLESAEEAQNAPSYYGVFNLLWNGRLLSDHYVSKGRFKNILAKEILGKVP